MTTMPAHEMPSAMTVRELKRLMKEAGIETQRALAARLNVDKATVWRWLNRKININAGAAALIRQTLKPAE